MFFCLVGCAQIAPPPRFGAPLPSPEAIGACKTKLDERTFLTFTGLGAGMGGSLSGGVAGAEPSSNASGKLGFQIAAMGFGIIGGGVAITAAIVNNSFNASHCDATLAP